VVLPGPVRTVEGRITRAVVSPARSLSGWWDDEASRAGTAAPLDGSLMEAAQAATSAGRLAGSSSKARASFSAREFPQRRRTPTIDGGSPRATRVRISMGLRSFEKRGRPRRARRKTSPRA
jgi:hypothetical protein